MTVISVRKIDRPFVWFTLCLRRGIQQCHIPIMHKLLLSSIYYNFKHYGHFHLSKPLIRELLLAARLVSNIDLVVLRANNNNHNTDPLVGAIGEAARYQLSPKCAKVNDLRMNIPTLVDKIAGVSDSLNDFAVRLAVLDLESILLGSYDAELASDNNSVVGRGSTVLQSVRSNFCTSNGTKTYKGTLSIRGNVEVVGV